MKYTYEQMPDKTKEGVLQELSKGLGNAAFHFQTSLGIPLEVFQDWLAPMTNPEKLLWYMNFRNEHPELY